MVVYEAAPHQILANTMNFSTAATRRLSKTNLLDEVPDGNASDSDAHRQTSNPNKIIYARVSPSPEKNFTQVLLPVAISYETFLCKVCVALGVDKEDVKKVVKLPDILIKSTEDVIRLGSHQKVEVILYTGFFPKLFSAKRKEAKKLLRWALAAFFALLFATTTALHARTESLLSSQLQEIRSISKALDVLGSLSMIPQGGASGSTDQSNVVKLAAVLAELKQDLMRIGGRQQALQAHIDAHFGQVDAKLSLVDAGQKRLQRELDLLGRKLSELDNDMDLANKDLHNALAVLVAEMREALGGGGDRQKTTPRKRSR